MTEYDWELPEDLIRGAVAIGRFITPYEEAQKLNDKQLARKAYHLIATSTLPAFHLGGQVAIRKSVVLRWIALQENRNSGKYEKSNPSLKLAARQHS